MGATFSRQVKEELLRVACGNACCRETELASAWLAAGRLAGAGDWQMVLSLPDVADRLESWMRRQWQLEPERWRDGIQVHLQFSGPAASRVDAARAGLAEADPDHLSLCCRQAMLRAAFLCGGSIANPRAGYRLELAIVDSGAAEIFNRLLTGIGLRPQRGSRKGRSVLSFREGQQVAQILLLSGAQQSLLGFEALRVEKEVRNQANRMVNCDSANSQRIAVASARQNGQLRLLASRGLLPRLPDELRRTAELRLEHPDLSLTELGALFDPPLGKSGVNHRLQRLWRNAASLLDGMSGNKSDHGC